MIQQKLKPTLLKMKKLINNSNIELRPQSENSKLALENVKSQNATTHENYNEGKLGDIQTNQDEANDDTDSDDDVLLISEPENSKGDSEDDVIADIATDEISEDNSSLKKPSDLDCLQVNNKTQNDKLKEVEESVDAANELKTPTKENAEDVVVFIIEDDDDVPVTEIQKETVPNSETTLQQNSDAELATCKIIGFHQLNKKSKELKPTEEIGENSDLLVDNSDNPCDNFEKRETETILSEAEDVNSNSSRNLLRPSQKPAPSYEESCKSGEAVDDSDVELIEDDVDEKLDETKDSPNKRLRLSRDSNEENKKTEKEPSEAIGDVKDESSNSSSGLKRPHACLDDNSSETKFKEATEEVAPVKKTKVEEAIIKDNKDDKDPGPNLKTNFEPIKLEFFTRIRKTFDKLTKTDLEDIVLQKVVEAIQFKSELTEIRDQLEKQDKTITNYRKKVAEATKQFLDLELVHKQLAADLEAKNSQFVMPVKITRAVGLQARPPYKKILKATLAASNKGHNSQLAHQNVIAQRSSQSVPVPPQAGNTGFVGSNTKRDVQF